MSEENYLKDISEIKNMMNKSSRFISLSGLSGILAGIYAIIGAVIANILLIKYVESEPYSRSVYDPTIMLLFVTAITVVTLSIVTGIILSFKKSKAVGESMWNTSSKRLLINFLIPLLTGGVFCLILLKSFIIGFIAPCTLIFYGLALVNASKYTLGDIRYLGLTNIILGLIATQFVGYGLYFWAFGFGIMHIVYGTLMYFKYDKK